METKHTPGPWTYSKGQGLYEQRYVIDSEPGRALAVCAGFEPRNEANARLIAAAPELLALMQDVLPILESMDHQREEGDEPMPLIDQVRATIAKATGKTL